jgi:hypothetical protein
MDNPVVVKPDALSKKLFTIRVNGSIPSPNGFTYMYGMLPKKLSKTKLKTIRMEACLRFIGVFSP